VHRRCSSSPSPARERWNSGVRRLIVRRGGFRAHFSLYPPPLHGEEAEGGEGAEAGLGSVVERREPELEPGWVLVVQRQELSPLLPLNKTGDGGVGVRLLGLGRGGGGVRVSLLLLAGGVGEIRWGWGVGRI